MSLKFFRNLLVSTARPSLRPPLPNTLTHYSRWSQTRQGSTLAFPGRNYSIGGWFGVAGGVGLGLAASAFANPINCESTGSPASQPVSPPAIGSNSDNGTSEYSDHLPPPPVSAVNLYELSFGTVTGVCAGVFVKKGAKALAFVIGGVFVLLQYFNSLSLIRIDWGRAASKFENAFYTTEANGVKRPLTISSVWRWLVNFLTADFQPRASFVAGMALGLRLG